jgi:Protein of unknown function (DUF2934)
MTEGKPTASDAEVASLAHQLWEEEGRPEGRDREHWQRAREILDGSAAPGPAAAGRQPRPVQPGFEDTPPGLTPVMKQDFDPDELSEDAGGRFAEQVSDLPEDPPTGKARKKATAGLP